MSKLAIYTMIICQTIVMANATETTAQHKFLKEISVELETGVGERSLLDLVSEIESKSDFHFAYSKAAMRKLSVEIDGGKWNMDELMMELSKQLQLSIRRVNSTISLMPVSDDTELPAINEEFKVQLSVSGKVTDENGEGLPGASILEKGTTNGTITDVEGNFSLNASEEATLTFSFVGYETKEIPINGQSVIDVSLATDISSLDEIVVVGYGTQKKVNVTGAVSTISSKEITRMQVGQTSMALQGAAPGVTVTQRSGQPGADGGQIRIRGIGTLGDSNPLIMVDGVETDLNNVDPNEIESISVLKDAASAAIYGARAANGVVLITTKRGEEGVNVSYNAYAGYQVPTRLPDVVGAIDHMEMVNEAFTNIGNSPQYTDQFIQEYRENMASDPDHYPDTDWQELSMYDAAFMQSHNVSLNAGGQRARVFASLSYLDQNGIIPNTNFHRYNIRVNSDVNITNKLTGSLDVFLRRTERNQPSNGTGYVFHWMRRIPSNEVGLLSNGRYGEGWNGDHPLARAKDGGLWTNESLDAILNFRLDYKFTDWLSAELMYAPRFLNPHEKRFYNITQTYARDGVTPTHFVPQRNSLTESFEREWYNNLRFIVTIDKEINGVHNFGATLGYQQEDQTNNWISAYREVFPLPQYDQINAGNRANEQTGGSATHWALQSIFGRVTYNFQDRYLFEANVRRDGSSRFSDGNRYGVFPSFSTGWRISEESFMQGTSTWLDHMKIRASWGQLGNQNIGLYPFASFMQIGGSSADYAFDNANAPGAVLNDLANPNIVWETSETTDIGLEANLWGKLDITLDYYYRVTNDILLRLNIPQTVGLTAPFQNAGTMENKGWDAVISYRDKAGDLNYGITLNLSDVQNKILDLKGIEDTGLQVNREGHPFDSFFGYQALGLFQSEDEIQAHATQFGNVAPGDIKYADLNDDGLINDQDLTVIGSPIPRYTFGARINLEYQGWDLSMFLQGVGKADGYLFGQGIMPFYVGGTVHEQHKDRWTPDNPDASFPRFAWNQVNNEQNSSFWMRNAAYLRGRNLQIGYSFPDNIMDRMNIGGIRVYLSGQNLFTIDDFYTGYDPEAPVSTGGWYPQMSVYTLGLNVNF